MQFEATDLAYSETLEEELVGQKGLGLNPYHLLVLWLWETQASLSYSVKENE